MNEAETSVEHIDPKIKSCGWGIGNRTWRLAPKGRHILAMRQCPSLKQAPKGRNTNNGTIARKKLYAHRIQHQIQAAADTPTC